MLKRCVLLHCLGLALCALPPAFAAQGDLMPPHGRYIPELDGRPVRIDTADGHGWVAWSYRNGSDFDIAVAELVEGIWSEPTLLDSHDGLDQVEPALADDESGNLYLVYTVRPTGAVRLAVFSAARRTWAPPVQLSALEQIAGQPNLKIVGDRLVVAFREGSRVQIVSITLHQVLDKGERTIVDGPDPINGAKK